MAEDRPPTASDIKRGVKKPISVEFRMAYAACWTLCDAQGRALMCVRYAHVPEGGAEAMEQRLRTDLDVLHRKRPDLLICTLADGAPEMQAILDRVVEGYEVRARMVDFFHLAEYLGSAAASMGREVAPTLARHKGYLLAYDSGVDAVLTELLAWQREAGPTGPPEALDKAITYVTNQKSRLRYASAYRAGLPIGSGHVEATAKTIFETRMKRTGARWRPEGGQALLGLRALATSSPERWRAGMREVLSTFRATVVPTDRRR